MSARRPLEDRLWEKVERDPVGCWIWRAALDTAGYGQIGDGNKKLLMAHRAVYTLCIGPIPPGLQVCHTCDNPICVRPTHLFLGTAFDNMRDMADKGRGNRALVNCINGHAFDGANTVVLIRENGRQRRACRACRRASSERYEAKRCRRRVA